MKLVRYAVGFVLGVALVLVASACMPPAGASQRWIDSYSEEVRTMNDGRHVTCLVLASGIGYSLECDWAGASR